MIGHALSDTYNDLQRLDSARTRGALVDAMFSSLQDFGVTKSIAALVSHASPPGPDTAPDLLVDRWPADWIERYFEMDYMPVDPVFRRKTGPHGAARWRDVFGGSRDPVELQIMAGARECRLRDGFTFAFPMADGASAAISFSGDAIECGDEHIGRIAAIAHFTVCKAIALRAAPEAAPVLTNRERDVLLWTCEGKTEWEIGAILGVSEHSVDKYVRALKVKLAATSKTQMVARAFRLGLL